MNEVKPISIIVQSSEHSHSNLYNELEKINFKSLHLKYPIEKNRREGSATARPQEKWATIKDITGYKSDDIRDQYALFQDSMKWILICGQCLGLNPVMGLLEKDSSNMRFKYFSWRFLHGILLCFIQMVATLLCLYKLYRTFISIKLLAFLSYYAATGMTTFLFIRVAAKWPSVLQGVYNSNLDEYIDTNLKFKCRITIGVMLTLAIVEHILSLISNMSETLDCGDKLDYLYEAYIEHSFPWLFEIGMPFSVPLGIIIQFLNLTCTLNWSYSDFFIICISFYLTSILEQISTKVIFSRDKSLPPAFWRQLREDYTQAGRLVRNFDNAISGIIFTSFASNLFFICLQLFNVLSHGLRAKPPAESCPNFPSGPFGGFENVVYFTFSLVYVLARFLAVSLVTANIHSTSNEPASALYDIPSSAYCSEIQRFIEQVHGETLALSGLQFFHITKSLVLTVASTIVTYELVLLQFNGEEMVHRS
ncbi:gustatory receptor for sugar taste 64b-like [Achroia grisella]|uniref:gustatory receptor for sugar taste 64b-like n=1 Tax=Achroia grisella TaxID=688607 RepID=UPI0027D33EEB|nr:gustatory receptor for sugar taste 64b-like [Achroia grisella]